MEYCLYRSSTGSWNVSTIFKLELIFIITFWFISNLRFILSKVTVHWDTCLIILFNFSTACIITCARFYLQKCYENKLEWAFCLKFIFRIKEGMGAVMMKMKKKLTLMLLKDPRRIYPAYLILAKQLLKVFSKDKEGTYGGFYLKRCYQNELELQYLFQVCPLFKYFSFLKTTRLEWNLYIANIMQVIEHLNAYFAIF